MHIGYEVI